AEPDDATSELAAIAAALQARAAGGAAAGTVELDLSATRISDWRR
ncbi:MAG: hypothetical protein QOI66_1286, partial [Myxococcales bacterium]|nr:hypothetical protein [Myxococcales bacterium]